MEAQGASMSHMDDLADPVVKGRLRRRLIAPLQRARAIYLGLAIMFLIIIGILITAVVFLRLGAAITGLVALWPAYIIVILGYISTMGFRDRKMWSFVLAMAVGVVYAGLGVALIVGSNGVPNADGNKAFAITTLGLRLAPR